MDWEEPLSNEYPDKSERPVMFVSHTLCKSERDYAQFDREALALYWTVKTFNHFLEEKLFTLVTNQYNIDI